MAKVHKTIRLEEEQLSRVTEWGEANGAKNSTEAIVMLLERALSGDAVRPDQTPTEAASGDSGTEHAGADYRAVIDVLRASNADLRATVSTLTAQLVTKDEQIRHAHELTDQAQRLHMAEVARALPAEGESSESSTGRSTLRERLSRIFGGR